MGRPEKGRRETGSERRACWTRAHTLNRVGMFYAALSTMLSLVCFSLTQCNRQANRGVGRICMWLEVQ